MLDDGSVEEWSFCRLLHKPPDASQLGPYPALTIDQPSESSNKALRKTMDEIEAERGEEQHALPDPKPSSSVLEESILSTLMPSVRPREKASYWTSTSAKW